MGQNPWLVAFAPIKIVTAGGFLAVTYLKNREATALNGAIKTVAKQLQFNDEWVNEAMAIFVTKETRETIFRQADEQDIVLFGGKHLEVRAAPIEWALERKLRRIYTGVRDRKAELDMADAVAMLRTLRERKNGLLDMESIRTLNLNGFDVCPDRDTMQRIADHYRQQYHDEVFK